MYFNPYSIEPLIISLLHLIIGYFIFAKNKNSVINRAFALECTSVSIWLFGYFIVYSSSKPDIALFWCKFAYIGVIFIPVFFYHFTVSFLGAKNKKFIILNYLISFTFLILIFTTDKFIEGTYKYYWGYQTKVGYLHNIYISYFIGMYLYCLLSLFLGYLRKRHRSLLEANKIKYVLFAYMIASIGAIDFIPNYGIEFYPFASIFVAAGFMTINYAIVRYRLMDINIAITRAGIFAFVYTLVLGLPFGIAGMMKELIHRKPQWSFVPMSLLALLATVGPFIYMRLQRKFEARLRAEEFRSHEALRRLSHNMLRFTNLDVLLNLIVHHLVKVLKLNFASVYIYDSRDEKFTLRGFWKMGEAVELPLEFSKDSSLVKDLYQRRYPIVTGEVKLFAPKGISPHIKNLLLTLAKLKANTVIPSFLRNELLAFLVLSDRRTNLDFTQEDLNLLMVLSNEAALAIENAQFHQRDKMKLVEKSRREALADMAPGASHQFNNRLAAISSSAELLLLKLENLKINSVKDENVKAILEDTKATLEMIDKEVYKGKEITQAILKRAKAKVDFQELDVPNLIKSVYRIVMVSHSRLGGKSYKEPGFKLTLVNKIPLIYASEALLQDCFYNLIDNACDVFQEKLKDNSDFQPVIEVVLKEEGRKVSIEIKDNGIGLTEENKRKLFTPYFTTKASSTKGTGLGLYVIRDFIEMHKGTIVCDSEYGKGTTFTIRLPIKGKNKQ